MQLTMRSFAKRLAVLIVAVLALIGAISLFALWDAKRSLESADFSSMAALIGNRAADHFVRPIPGTRAALATSLEEFKTFTISVVVVGHLLEHPDLVLPSSSEALKGLSPESTLDAWGRPFCLVAYNNRVAVVSLGPSKTIPQDACRTTVKRSDIAELKPGIMWRYQTGILLLVAERDELRRLKNQNGNS